VDAPAGTDLYDRLVAVPQTGTDIENEADHTLFVRVKNALGENLHRVRHLLEDSGFWLDDHYRGVRNALRSNA
jgi:hypothetical protein